MFNALVVGALIFPGNYRLRPLARQPLICVGKIKAGCVRGGNQFNKLEQMKTQVVLHSFDALSFDVRVKFRDHAEGRIGLRLPVGVSYTFNDLPLDVFCEVAPVIDFAPSTRGGSTAGVGARWLVLT